MSWKDEVEEIERRRERARQGGGAEASAHQHARGRLTVRERIEALVDSASFREIGALAGHAEPGAGGLPPEFTPASLVAGVARIDGRLCVVAGDDFTLRGAAYSPAGLRKGLYAEEIAVARRLPLPPPASRLPMLNKNLTYRSGEA